MIGTQTYCLHVFVYLVIAANEASREFIIRCPHESHWNIIADKRCKESKLYHCLFDSNHQRSVEMCAQPYLLPAGLVSIYSGDRDARDCSAEHFSPFATMTNRAPTCTFKKSICSEEGQIHFSNGTNTEDVTCRCDYTRGYAFLVTPIRHSCFCVPQIEDCSCFKKSCPKDHILSQDYKCIRRQDLSSVLLSCPEIKRKRIENKDHHEYDKNLETTPRRFSGGLKNKAKLSLVAIVILVCCFVAFTCLLVNRRENIQNFKDIAENYDVALLSFIPEMLEVLQDTSILILKGRKGTGKSTIGKYFLQKYQHLGYKICSIFEINKNTPDLLQNCMYGEWFIFFDNIVDWEESCDILKSALKLLSLNADSTKRIFILAIMNQIPKEIEDTLQYTETIVGRRNIVFDLDEKDMYTIADRQRIFTSNMFKYDLRFEDEVSGDSRCNNSSINRKQLETILKEETFIGQPWMYSSFCSKVDHIRQGLQYFRQPPAFLITAVDLMREKGRDNMTMACQFCILVSVLLDKEKNFKIGVLVGRPLSKCLENIFSLNPKLVADDLRRQIVKKLNPFYLTFKNETVTFSHQMIHDAVMISYYKMNPKDVLEKCSIADVLSYLRPQSYKPLSGEAVLSFNVSKKPTFVKHMASSILSNENAHSAKVVTTLRKFIEHGDTSLLFLVLKELKNLQTKKYQGIIAFFKPLGDLLHQHAFKCEKEILFFSLAWEYVGTRMDGNSVLSSCLENSAVEIDFHVFCTPLDQVKNSLLHYLIIWNCKRERKIITALLGKLGEIVEENAFQKAFECVKLKNSKNHSPFHFAVFLGRYYFIEEVANILRCRPGTAEQNKIALCNLFGQPALPPLIKEGKKHIHQTDTSKLSIKFDSIIKDFCITFGETEDFVNIAKIIEQQSGRATQKSIKRTQNQSV